MSDYDTWVCADCGVNLQSDGFIHGICPACGGNTPVTRVKYESMTTRQPAPSEHAPRKYAAFSGDGEFVVAEERNPNAWVCVDVSESKRGLLEVEE